ncbi:MULTISPECIES: glycine zipper 2TM domain-containing protein [Comamonas]|jgi:outer membrane lipoprotein SlyB|uniref:Glycine zipper 2TM domain-containing protein n=1 Tax=Comamonas sediminis TaxID=1783360 RepID=A0ABV4AXM3_9BURK|nr:MULTISPECIES: glycine zipper 2TM domain-containing protein [unclassified Comamonas]ULR90418.1 glycine zipper 2TM domain-containing protein [Comamonas sp. B21-038]
MSQTNPSSRSMLQRAGKLGLALAATSVLAACVQAPPRYDNRYPQGPAPQQQGSYPQQGGYPQQQAPYGMEYGTVANIEELRSQSRSTSGVGAILGAVVGGVLGNQVGGGFGRMAATAAGVAGGAAAGNALEQSSNGGRSTVSGYRIHINLQNGGQRIFDVPNPGDLRPGDRVQINQGQISRY